MIISSNLCSVPFISSVDSTRLQMSAKQINQTLTHPHTEIAKVIGSNWRYLTNTSNYFIKFAHTDGTVHYVNDQLMVVEYDDIGLEVYQTPYIYQTTSYYAVTLRFRHDVGDFKKGDILYEYDSFIDGMPAYGYNILTLFGSWFGFTHEDAMVISESASDRIRSTKIERVIIEVRENTLFKEIYEKSPFKFIPNIGETINDSIIYQQIIPKNKIDIRFVKLLKNNRIQDIVDDKLNFKLNFKLVSKLSKINKAKVIDIRVHQLSNRKLLNPSLQTQIERLKTQYYSQIKLDLTNLESLFGRDYTKYLAVEYYKYLSGSKDKSLVYIIELTLSGENKCEVGDKLANRFAGKGVVSLILPDEFRPQVHYSKDDIRPADLIFNSIGIFARMNFGQVLEAIVSDIIVQNEMDLLSGKSTVYDIFNNFTELASEVFNDAEYVTEIQFVRNTIRQDSFLENYFVKDVKNKGLFFEIPNFTKFDMRKLIHIMKNRYNLQPYKRVTITRECLKYMKDKLGINISIPHNDIELPNMFAGYMYLLKLKYESKALVSARDFGLYKSTNKQPMQGRNITGISTASKLGQMEMDALLASGLLTTLKEMRTVKNDRRSMKVELVAQTLNNNRYNMNIEKHSESYVKKIINSLIEFVNHQPS